MVVLHTETVGSAKSHKMLIATLRLTKGLKDVKCEEPVSLSSYIFLLFSDNMLSGYIFLFSFSASSILGPVFVFKK